ncbi:hypothetical protein MRX96_032124 [Rhipicephalus microplus]
MHLPSKEKKKKTRHARSNMVEERFYDTHIQAITPELQQMNVTYCPEAASCCTWPSRVSAVAELAPTSGMTRVGNQTNTTDPAAVNSRIFIGILNTHVVPKEDVERLFKRCGRIIDISVHKGYAFVQYTDTHDARNVVLGEDGRTIAGQILDVNMVSEPKPHQVNRKRQNLAPDPFATLRQLGSPLKAPAPSRSPSGQPAPSAAATRALPRRNCTRTPSRTSSSAATTGRCFRVCRSCSTTSATTADCASPAAATWSGSLWPTHRLTFRCPSALNAWRAAEVGGSWPATLKLLMRCPSATMHPLEAATNTDEHDPKSLQ